jgi:mRNA interferase MazF
LETKRGSSEYVPERGELIWLTFDPRLGHEQAGRRPAVVLSPSAYNAKTSLAICCPITSRRKGYPFEVALPDDLAVSGVVLSDQMKSLDWRARRAERIADLPSETLSEIMAKASVLLGVDR